MNFQNSYQSIFQLQQARYSGVSIQRKTFSQSAFVYGLCITDRQNFKISKGTTDQTVKVFIKPTCQMRIGDSDSFKRLLGVSINLNITVEPDFRQSCFDVWMKSYTFDIQYNDSYGFALTNKTLADQIVKESLDRLNESPLFGSGWPIFLSQRDPAMYVSENYVMIYSKPQNVQLQDEN